MISKGSSRNCPLIYQRADLSGRHHTTSKSARFYAPHTQHGSFNLCCWLNKFNLLVIEYWGQILKLPFEKMWVRTSLGSMIGISGGFWGSMIYRRSWDLGIWISTEIFEIFLAFFDDFWQVLLIHESYETEERRLHFVQKNEFCFVQ